MRFGILGPLEVRDGHGRPVTIRHPAERSLLLRLVVADGEPVPVDRLAAELDLAGAARAGLFDRVRTLRRRLEPGLGPGAPARLLVTTPEGYAVRGAGLARDDHEAAGLAAGARAELAAGRAGAAGERAAEALALFRGRALADAGDAPWADAERRRLAGLAAGARLVAAAALAVDRPAHAGPALDEAQALRPHDGRLWALRAAADLARERDVEALRVLRRARLAIEATGRDRGPALRAMEAAVLRADHPAARALCLRLALDDALADGVLADALHEDALHEDALHELAGADALPDLEYLAVSGDAVGRRIQWLPSRTRRLVALLATTELAMAELVTTGPGPDGGMDRVLLARAAGLTPELVAEHLDPAVAVGLVTVPADGAARLSNRRAAPAVLAVLSPFERRCLGRLVGQAARTMVAPARSGP